MFENSDDSPIQACPICEALIDISDEEPLALVPCPSCGAEIAVRGTIDHFTLVDVAGRGGMGVVYRALDGSLDREVALKLLRKDHSDNAALISQLEAEAGITASINHPHVVKVYSTGVNAGRFYIAMELVDKGSLDDLIRIQGRVAEAQALEVAIDIAQGLRAAHQAGLIHRDVKPGNILFADAHTAKIVDFGLAIFMAQEESVRGEIWGTPYYVAPEKLDDKPEDFRSDIYSLGASLFHALAGRPPFEAESASLVALKHLKAQPVSLQAFAPHVSGRTAYIINRTLLKEPEKRYQSYDELIEHLEYAREELLTAPQKVQSSRVVLEDETQQRTWGWVTMGMIAVVAIAAGLFLVFRKSGTDPSDTKATATSGVNSKPPSVSPEGDAARAKLVSGSPSEAANDFRKIASQTSSSQVDIKWSALQEGLAELLVAKPDAARMAFDKVREHPLPGQRPEERRLEAFFTATADRMTGNSAIRPSSVDDISSTSYEMFSLLLFGVKDWQLGEVEDSATLLRRFRNVSPDGGTAWIAQLKPLASRFIDEYTGFQMAADRLKSATNPDQRADALDELRGLGKSFQARVDALSAPYKEEMTALEKARSLPPVEGLYRLVNRKTGKVLDVSNHSKDEGAGVQVWDSVDTPNQQWNLAPQPDGTLRLTAENSGKSLEEDRNSGRLRQAGWKQKPEQKWRPDSSGRGFFKLLSAADGKALSLSSDDPIQLVTSAPGDAFEQQWKFVPLAVRVGDWTAADIGRVSAPGSTALDAGTGAFTIRSTGADIWGAEDSTHFVYRKVSGDFEVVARVMKLDKPEWSKTGVMVRESRVADARNVSVVMASSHGLSFQVRKAAKSVTTSVKDEGVHLPHWVKIARHGDTLTGYHSKDGVEWVQVAAETLAKLRGDVYAGIAASSHMDGVSATSVVQDVKITPTP